MKKIFTIYIILIIVFPIKNVCGADWPMWHHDHLRSSVTSEQLSEKLFLQWKRKFNTPIPAWPQTQKKLQFDAAYEPVVSGHSIFVPSMISDSVTAYDTRSGDEKWKFYAEGPVRFAPAIYKDKIYFVSDDGCLYCLDSSDGTFLWKIDGGASGDKIIGNGRLIDMRPARGAPVIFEEKVYFSVGVWPFMGIFIYCINANSGDVIWCNSGSGSVYIKQQHSSPAFAGVSPQGYLAVSADKLVISGGRTVPAVYDKNTGKFLYYDVSSRQFGRYAGGYSISIAGDYFINTQKDLSCIYRLNDGSGVLRYRPGIYTAEHVWLLENKRGTLAFAKFPPKKYKAVDRKGENVERYKFSILSRKKIADLKNIHIIAGKTLFGSGPNGTIIGIDISDKEKTSLIWTHKIDETPHSMIVADNRLFVSTLEGGLYCFGKEKKQTEIKTLCYIPNKKTVTKKDKWTVLVKNVLKKCGDKPGGYALLFGISSERLLEELFSQSKMNILAFDSDKQKVEKLRRQFYSQKEIAEKMIKKEKSKAEEKNDFIEIKWPEEWRVIGPFSKETSVLSAQLLKDLPKSIVHEDQTYVAKNLKSYSSTLDFTNLYGGFGFKPLAPGEKILYPRGNYLKDEDMVYKTAYAFAQIDVPRDGRIILGAGADWWMQWFIDGAPVFNTLKSGNNNHPINTTNYVFAPELKKGKHVIAVMVKSGSGGWILSSGSDLKFVKNLPKPKTNKKIKFSHRISIYHAEKDKLHLPPYLADLIMLDETRVSSWNEKEKGFFDILRPYGGVACIPIDKKNMIKELIPEIKSEKPRLSKLSGYLLLNRKGPLPGAGEWTHQYADVANSVVSKEKRVRTPLGLLWFGGPSNTDILPRHGHGPSPQVVGGRIFIEGPDIIRSLDVYTGRILWERVISDIGKFYDNTRHHPGANEIGSNYVSVSDGIYVITPSVCLQLNPKNGETIKTYKLPSKDNPSKKAIWGSIAVYEDLLVATSSPISISWKEKGSSLSEAKADFLIKKNSLWQYMTEKDLNANGKPPAPYVDGWKSGKAGFGYGDNDDQTVLKDMKKNYRRICIMKSFSVDDPEKYHKIILKVNYDDGFIAYLNDREIVRSPNLKDKGAGEKISSFSGHEARKFSTFDITNMKKILKKGNNILALEGYNVSLNSSDMSLDPYLIAILSPSGKEKPQTPSLKTVPGVNMNAKYASSSRDLVVLDRHSGEILWTRKAEYNFRHNSICAGNNKIFCMDGMTSLKLNKLKRYGIKFDSDPTIYALDAKSGKILWKKDEGIEGSWLAYSEEHDVLVRGHSHGRDRAKDEKNSGGISVYRASDGKELWSQRNLGYAGPFMLYHDRIITQGTAFKLLTGIRDERENPITGKKMPWWFVRNYGCNTAVACENLITFRSAAAGYYDLANDGGTGNFGGFKSGCTSNLIAGDGVLVAPDYTKTCTCSYQNQSSVGMIHMQKAEKWTFTAKNKGSFSLEKSIPKAVPVKKIGINFGAPGDRKAADGILWLDYPSVGGPSPDIPVTTSPETPYFLSKHSSVMQNTDYSWVAASYIEGADTIKIDIGKEDVYNLRLFFSEPKKIKKGERVFSVSIQGKEVLSKFDIIEEVGSADKIIIREFKDIKINKILMISMSALKGSTVLSGIEISASK